MGAFFQGLIAGYGLAIPIGPIGIIILELGLRRGVRVAFFAGLGTASADLIYAILAAFAGTALAAILAPFSFIIRLASATALIVIGIWLFYRGVRFSRPMELGSSRSDGFSTYGMLLGLTLMNPVTITYFTSLILGLRISVADSTTNAMLFIAGVFLASLSWQSFLACLGGFAHRRLSARLQSVTFAAGSAVVIVLGVAILLGFRV